MASHGCVPIKFLNQIDSDRAVVCALIIEEALRGASNLTGFGPRFSSLEILCTYCLWSRDVL